MTTSSKTALRAELEAALANYRGPVKQCRTSLFDLLPEVVNSKGDYRPVSNRRLARKTLAL